MKGDVPMSKRFPPRVSGRITGTHKLYSLQVYPGLIRGTIESSMFHYLTEKWNHSLSTYRGRGICGLGDIYIMPTHHICLYLVNWSHHRRVPPKVVGVCRWKWVCACGEGVWMSVCTCVGVSKTRCVCVCVPYTSLPICRAGWVPWQHHWECVYTHSNGRMFWGAVQE